MDEIHFPSSNSLLASNNISEMACSSTLKKDLDAVSASFIAKPANLRLTAPEPLLRLIWVLDLFVPKLFQMESASSSYHHLQRRHSSQALTVAPPSWGFPLLFLFGFDGGVLVILLLFFDQFPHLLSLELANSLEAGSSKSIWFSFFGILFSFSSNLGSGPSSASASLREPSSSSSIISTPFSSSFSPRLKVAFSPSPRWCMCTHGPPFLPSSPFHLFTIGSFVFFSLTSSSSFSFPSFFGTDV